ncbi:glycosyltransferase family 2 protein [Prochlorococcus sp. AH-716-P08]|nr:glycosyltransferase family 2 protein [Prochlorococcus sp. AH-716-P08]
MDNIAKENETVYSVNQNNNDILLTVIVPCFNEINTIEKVIKKIKTSSVQDKEIIIVDDFSTDGSREYLKNFSDKKVTIKFHSRNKGKGAAIRTGIKSAKGKIIIIQDADLEYDPNEYHNVISPIINNKADVVYGSRFKGGQPHRVVYFWHRVGNGFLTLLSNIFTDLNLSDMETCYKAFRSEVIKNIRIDENRFGFEPEITAKISRRNYRIFEVGISYYGRTYKEGKKIGWKDGIHAIWCILKYNLIK